MQTVVPKDSDGNLDLTFEGTKMEVVTDGPAQSALPGGIIMTEEQHARLGKLAYQAGDHQEMCRRIYEHVHGKKDGRVASVVLSTDLARIKQAVDGGATGGWQDLFREILKGKAP